RCESNPLDTQTSSSSEKSGIQVARFTFVSSHKSMARAWQPNAQQLLCCARSASRQERRSIMAGLIPSKRNRHDRGNLARRDAFPLDRLRDQFDTVFDRFFGNMTPMWDREEMRLWDFSMDNRDKEIVVRAELPGFEPNDLDVQVQGDMLTIRAEHREQSDQEQSFNSFQRSITLPSGVQTEGAQASYRNGVLELHLPKAQEQVGKRIPIGEQKHADQSAKAEPSKK